MFKALHLLHASKPSSISVFILSTLITFTIIPATFCSTMEEETKSQQSGMRVIRFGDRPASKTNSQNKMKSIKNFTTTGFVVGTCKMAKNSNNTVSFAIGEQKFSKTIGPAEPNDEKEIILTSNSDPYNTITITHIFHSRMTAIKLTDALWSYFGHFEHIITAPDSCKSHYIGDNLCSTSIDLSSIIAPESISAAPGTAPKLYGICITYNPETNKVLYTLTDDKTSLAQTFDHQREVTAVDDVKRSIDFGNGISIIASVYGENVHLLMERALEYEIFQVLL